MEYATFGKTGRKVSRLGFGGAPAGLKNYLREFDPQDQADRRKIIDAIHKALELGVNYFDTAPGYGSGQSEELFGEALEGINPDEIFIATKVGFSKEKGWVQKSLEASLKRLRRSYIDLIQIHGNSYDNERTQHILKDGSFLDEMREAKRQGLVKHIGFTSEDNNKGMYDLIECSGFDMMQICYNLFFQHPYDPNRPFGSLFEAEKAGMGISAMRPTTSGLFQKWMGMVHPENAFDYTRALIQFAFSNPLVDVVLIGMRSAERVLQNVEICNDTSGRIDIGQLFKYYV